jgi:hypothetical protein
MILALVLAAAPLIQNERVVVYEAQPDPGPLQHDAVVLDFATQSARFVQKGRPLAVSGPGRVIELLGPPSGPIANPGGLPDAFAERPGIEKLFSNDRVNVWRYQWQPGKPTPMHFHPTDTVVTFFADGTLESIAQDGKRTPNENRFGMTKFSPRGRAHQEVLIEGAARAVMVELK